jgi:mono/diheme cytochrome c family protein
MKIRTFGATAAVTLVVAAAGLYAWTRQAEITPAIAAVHISNPAVLAEGARIVALGDCMVCHTSTHGAAYAGGLGLSTPFGTIYSTNITPDPDTGIGRWSLSAFRRALREGVARDGHLLYPAFPYIHYTRMSDHDIELAYGYLMSREPIRVRQPDNELIFPLRLRPLLAFWNVLYLEPGGDSIPPKQASALARGRYLVDTLGHCASCHSGMNLLGGERSPAFRGGMIDGWEAPSLVRLNRGAVPWRDAELVAYLRGGLSVEHGAAKGPMRPVTERLAQVPVADVEAIATYLMSIQLAPPPAARPRPAQVTAASAHPVTVAHTNTSDGLRLFTAACAGCHAPAAPMMRLGDRPGLGSSSTVESDNAANFVQTVLHGIPWSPSSRVYMPPFAGVLDDKQIAQLAAYVRHDIAGKPAWREVARTSLKLREESNHEH